MVLSGRGRLLNSRWCKARIQKYVSRELDAELKALSASGWLEGSSFEDWVRGLLAFRKRVDDQRFWEKLRDLVQSVVAREFDRHVRLSGVGFKSGGVENFSSLSGGSVKVKDGGVGD